MRVYKYIVEPAASCASASTWLAFAYLETRARIGSGAVRPATIGIRPAGRSFGRSVVCSARPVLELDISRGHDGAHVIVKWPSPRRELNNMFTLSMAISARYMCKPCDRVQLDHKSLHDGEHTNSHYWMLLLPHSLCRIRAAAAASAHSFNEKSRGVILQHRSPSAVAVHSSAVCSRRRWPRWRSQYFHILFH